MSRKVDLQVGDAVMYSRDWLRSTGSYTGVLPFARGEVTSFKRLGDLTLAQIDWHDERVPQLVNVRNLTAVKRLHWERV